MNESFSIDKNKKVYLFIKHSWERHIFYSLNLYLVCISAILSNWFILIFFLIFAHERLEPGHTLLYWLGPTESWTSGLVLLLRAVSQAKLGLLHHGGERRSWWALPWGQHGPRPSDETAHSRHQRAGNVSSLPVWTLERELSWWGR